MISPVAAAATDAINTAPAARSFTLPANGLISGDKRSTSPSIAEFSSSAVSTVPVVTIIANHSPGEILVIHPKRIAKRAAVRWIRKLCCSLMAERIPFYAKPKLFNRSLIINLMDFLFSISSLIQKFL